MTTADPGAGADSGRRYVHWREFGGFEGEAWVPSHQTCDALIALLIQSRSVRSIAAYQVDPEDSPTTQVLSLDLASIRKLRAEDKPAYPLEQRPFREGQRARVLRTARGVPQHLVGQQGEVIRAGRTTAMLRLRNFRDQPYLYSLPYAVLGPVEPMVE